MLDGYLFVFSVCHDGGGHGDGWLYELRDGRKVGLGGAVRFDLCVGVGFVFVL